MRHGGSAFYRDKYLNIALTGGAGTGAVADATIIVGGVKVLNENDYINNWIDGEGVVGDRRSGSVDDKHRVVLAERGDRGAEGDRDVLPLVPRNGRRLPLRVAKAREDREIVGRLND